jgi:MFS family permease
MSLVRGIGAAIGPTVGGALIDLFDRQAAALALAFGAAVLATILVPRRQRT